MEEMPVRFVEENINDSSDETDYPSRAPVDICGRRLCCEYAKAISFCGLAKPAEIPKGLVAQLCHAGLVLTACGLLRGRRTASYPALEPDIKAAGGVRQCRGSRRWSDGLCTSLA